MTGCDITGCQFEECNLSAADFSDSCFSETAFLDCSLKRADFRDAIGYHIDPRRNELQGAKLTSPEALSLLLPFGVIIDY